MNFKGLFLFFFMMTVLLQMSFAQSDAFTLKDFSHASIREQKGQAMLELNLSSSGQEKIQRLNHSHLDKKVSFQWGEKTTELTLRGPIAGDHIEAGPFSQEEAQKIVKSIEGN